MSFFKIFLMNVFCFNLVIAHQRHNSTNLAELSIKSGMLSAITGAVSGVIDVYSMDYIGFPFGFISEGKARIMLLNEVLFDNDLEHDERYENRKEIATWFGRAASWAAWFVVYRKYGAQLISLK